MIPSISEAAVETTDETAGTRLRSDRGAVGTEMAIVVAIVVTIALALGVVMRTSAQNHQNCIPQTPTQAPVAGC